mgnify:CR=1 FL=1
MLGFKQAALAGQVGRGAPGGGPPRCRCPTVALRQRRAARAALPGRDRADGVSGMGCFWGAERIFWRMPGVLHQPRWATRAATRRTQPTRECAPARPATPRSVLVVFDPAGASYDVRCRASSGKATIPTRGMRQGNDGRRQYRSAIYTCVAWSSSARLEASTRRLPGGRSRRATGRSPPRSARAARSTTPRTITSSTSPRIPGDTAASAAPAWRARLVSPPAAESARRAGPGHSPAGALQRLTARRFLRLRLLRADRSEPTFTPSRKS